MKKNVMLLVVIVIFALVLCACGEKKEEKQGMENTVVDNGEELNNEEDYEEENKVIDPADFDKLVISLNGASLKINEKFEDVKSRFGAESRPSQSYTPCGGSDDAQVTTHYYNGLEVEETAEGIIYLARVSGYEYRESQATIAGIKLGDTPETVRNTFGSTPDSDSEYTINYTFGTVALSYGLDTDGTGNVNHMSIDDFSLGGL